MRRMVESTVVLLVCLSIVPTRILSQSDTLRLSLAAADSLLISRNLTVLAAHYDIDKAKAQIVTAELFDNPSFSAESFLYGSDHRAIFDPGFQKSFSISQLLHIAGQRGLAIDIAEEHHHMSLLEFQRVTRELVYRLHSSYYSLYYLSNATRALKSQLERLHGSVAAYQTQYEKGNFSLKELTRLKASLFGLNNSYTSLLQEIADLQHDIRILTAEERVVQPSPTPSELRLPELTTMSTSALTELAMKNRVDVALSHSTLRERELLLRLEQRKAWPDVHVGLNYDQGGNIVNNYTGLTLGFDLPLFNRNQGGSAEAEAELRQAEAENKVVEQNVRREIESSVEKISGLREQYKQIGPTFLDDIDALSESVLQNYLNGNLSLMEFSDLFESYNSTIIDINRFYASLFKSYEDLNYVLGKEIVTH